METIKIPDSKVFSDISQLVRALDHKLRQGIIIAIADAGEINNTDLWVKLRIDQSVLSQHISILKAANIINKRKEGKYIYYSISEKYYSFIEKLDRLT